MGVFYNEGQYEAEVLEHAFQLTKNKDKVMIVLKLKITGWLDVPSGDIMPDQNQYERRIYMVIPDDEEGKAKVLAKLRGAGWEGTRFEDFNLDGRTVQVRCYHTEDKKEGSKYFGQQQENWDLRRPFESKPLEDDKSLAKKLNALFGKELKATAPKPASKPAPQPQTVPGDDFNPPYPEDETVPF